MSDKIVVMKLMGGLGNQMFQYALGRALAVRHDAMLLLDLSEYSQAGDRRPEILRQFSRKYQLDAFQIRGEVANANVIRRLADPHGGPGLPHAIIRRVRRAFPGFSFPRTHRKERGYTYDPSVEQLGLPVYLDGFWQSPRYFSNVADQLRTEFQFKNAELRDYARAFLSPLKQQCSTLVALHVRRGDLARAERHNSPHTVYGFPVRLPYVTKARAEFPTDAGFVVFSDTPDDIQWCREHIKGPRVFFSESHTDLQDFELMRSCDHNIIANSTFSWWAAWLNKAPGRRVIAPGEWSPPGKPNGIVTKDLLPSDWTVLERNEAGEV